MSKHTQTHTHPLSFTHTFMCLPISTCISLPLSLLYSSWELINPLLTMTTCGVRTSTGISERRKERLHLFFCFDRKQLIYPFTCPSEHLLIHLLVYPPIHLCIHPSTMYPLIIYLCMYPKSTFASTHLLSHAFYL